MTYEEFLDLPTTFLDDMAKLIDIKYKYHLDFTEEELEIKDYLLIYWEEMKLNELRSKFEKCLNIDDQN